MYLASERKEYILKALSDRGSVRTVVLSKEMDVTDETVRNDLITLEQSGLLKRVHGGAISLKKTVMNEVITTGTNLDVDIAKAAAKHVKDTNSVFLEGGVLGNMVASHIAPLPVTIVTNSPTIVLRLAGNSNVEVYGTGGLFDRQSGLLLGIAAAQSISKLGIDVIIIAPDSFDPERGAGYNSLARAEFVQEAASRAKKVIVLCPSALLSETSTYYPMTPNKTDLLITNEDAPQAILARIASSGIELEKA